MTFDLENALVLEEQLKENIDDAFSCMCGVCHTCGFDPKEMGEALAEIERLRAELASANVELMAAGEIVRAKAAPIKELEGMLSIRTAELEIAHSCARSG